GKHSGLRRPHGAALYRVEVRVADEPRHLREPHRRLSGKDRNEGVSARAAAKAPECLENRQVRLAGAAMLDALAAYGCGVPGKACEEALDDRRLADPRLARDERQSAPAGQGLVKQPLQMGEL